jgi:hypothetical protein
MALGFGTKAKATAYATAIYLAIGSEPIVEEMPGYMNIRFTPQQQKKLREFIERQMKKGMGDVRVEIAPVLMPIFLKRLLPLAGATLAGLFWFWRKPMGAAA